MDYIQERLEAKGRTQSHVIKRGGSHKQSIDTVVTISPRQETKYSHLHWIAEYPGMDLRDMQDGEFKLESGIFLSVEEFLHFKNDLIPQILSVRKDIKLYNSKIDGYLNILKAQLVSNKDFQNLVKNQDVPNKDEMMYELARNLCSCENEEDRVLFEIVINQEQVFKMLVAQAKIAIL